MIGVGFGNGRSKEKDGWFRVYRVERDAGTGAITELAQVYECKESRQWISDIKFSPDGRTLGIGAHDNSLYIYSVTSSFKRLAKFSKHNSFITHFDFSKVPLSFYECDALSFLIFSTCVSPSPPSLTPLCPHLFMNGLCFPRHLESVCFSRRRTAPTS